MSVDKKKKKLQVLEIPEPTAGSTEYIANREIDQIIKKGKNRIKYAITLSDEKLTRTKKSIVKEMAEDMEKANYPVNQICDRLAKSLKGLVHERTVRDALDAKYKNPIKSVEALQQQQNNGRGINYRDQQQVIKKPVEQITLEDLKLADFPKSKLKQIAKHQMEKNLFIEQQDKQNKDKEQTKTQEQFTAEFTMRFEESMMEDLLGIKLREEEKRTYVGKYYYLVAVKVKVDSIEGKVELIPPVVIMSKKLSDPEDRKKANS